MTQEGIIQQVISKYIQLHDCECPDKETNQWNELIRTKFQMIENELIERVIELHNQREPDCSCIACQSVANMICLMIGESKE